jgi:hypothetical protein
MERCPLCIRLRPEETQQLLLTILRLTVPNILPLWKKNHSLTQILKPASHPPEGSLAEPEKATLPSKKAQKFSGIF